MTTKTTTPRWRTPWNAAEFPQRGEVNNKPSLTIPDEALTIREIIERYVRGINFPGSGPAVYDEDEGGYFPDLSHMDLADQQEYVKTALEDADLKFKAAKDAKKSKEADEDFQRRLEAWKKENLKEDAPK